MPSAGEADEALQAASFAPRGEALDEGADDEDGSIGPPPRAFLVRGGGVQTSLRLNQSVVPIQLFSSDRDTGSFVGFVCAHDVSKGTFYAKLQSEDDNLVQGTSAERSTKGAITTLLDVAEACNSRKITIGLGPQHVRCAELICSLLYLGFQVVPTRRSPLLGTALLLDLEIGWSPARAPFSSDHTCTGTSECSTSAEDQDNASHCSGKTYDSD